MSKKGKRRKKEEKRWKRPEKSERFGMKIILSRELNGGLPERKTEREKQRKRKKKRERERERERERKKIYNATSTFKTLITISMHHAIDFFGLGYIVSNIETNCIV